jgi:hypothetical protein
MICTNVYTVNKATLTDAEMHMHTAEVATMEINWLFEASSIADRNNVEGG